MRATILAMTVTLGGCASGNITLNDKSTSGKELSQPDHRRIVADSIATLFEKNKDINFGVVEISDVRQVTASLVAKPLGGPTWLTCLKLDAHGKAQHYAIFIQDDKVVDSRLGVLADQCHKQTYTPFQISRN